MSHKVCMILSACAVAACGGSDAQDLFRGDGVETGTGGFVSASGGAPIGSGGFAGGSLATGGATSSGGTNVVAGGADGAGGSGPACPPCSSRPDAGVVRGDSGSVAPVTDGGAIAPAEDAAVETPDARSPLAGAFASCVSGDDCPGRFVCYRSGGDDPTGRAPGFCTLGDCHEMDNFDCPQPSTGTVVAECSSHSDYCTLDCTEGLCPDGMTCETINGIFRCNFPASNDGIGGRTN